MPSNKLQTVALDLTVQLLGLLDQVGGLAMKKNGIQIPSQLGLRTFPGKEFPG